MILGWLPSYETRSMNPPPVRIGVIGYGYIGRHVVERLLASQDLGLELAFDVFVSVIEES